MPEGRVDQGVAKRSVRKVLSGRRKLRGALRDRRIEVSSSGGWSRGVPYPFVSQMAKVDLHALRRIVFLGAGYSFRMNEGVILLVEDDQNFAELAKLGLEQAEFTNEVVLARDGEEAVEYLLADGREADEMPCLVLLDLHMPRLDGFGVLRRMRSDARTRLVPVVMLSSSDHPEDVRTAYEEGANAYLEKVSGRVPWPEQVQTVARFWLGLNLSAHS